MKVLVTGSTGFIGRHVVEALNKEGFELEVLSRSHGCDLLQPDQVSQYVKNSEATVLIHLAWDVTHGEYWESPKNDQYKDASLHLFNTFLDCGGHKIIGAGTSAEYPTAKYPVSEDMIVDKKDLSRYGQMKRECFEWLANRQCDFTWIRIFGIYGPGECAQKFFTSAIKSFKENQRFSVGNPDVFSDYVHVKDIANFIKCSVLSPGMGAINMGVGQGHALMDIYHALKNYVRSGEMCVKATVSSPSDNSRIPCVDKLKTLGWQFVLREF